MKGKEKCKALKEIRKQIAEQNDIAFAVSECTHQGECKGTCPKCEAEIAYLEKELAIKKNLGKAVVVAGIATSVCTGLTACSPVNAIQNIFQPHGGYEDLAGDVDIDVDAMQLEGDVPEPIESDEIDGGLEDIDESLDNLVEGELLAPDDYIDESETDCSAPDCTTDNDESEDYILEGDVEMAPFDE